METDSDNPLLRRPAITTLVLLTSLLVPLVAVPHALTRRHISRLTKRIDHLTADNANLQNAISKSAHETSLRREELARATSLLQKSKNEISLLRRDVSHIQAQLNLFQSTTRAELQSLLDEGNLTRQALPASALKRAADAHHSYSYSRHHLELLPRLGLSLADVAAFMHEVELHQGVPSLAIHSHSIERLRTLALSLQVSPTPRIRAKSGTDSQEACLDA